jgi:hypothetical protein
MHDVTVRQRQAPSPPASAPVVPAAPMGPRVDRPDTAIAPDGPDTAVAPDALGRTLARAVAERADMASRSPGSSALLQRALMLYPIDFIPNDGLKHRDLTSRVWFEELARSGQGSKGGPFWKALTPVQKVEVVKLAAPLDEADRTRAIDPTNRVDVAAIDLPSLTTAFLGRIFTIPADQAKKVKYGEEVQAALMSAIQTKGSTTEQAGIKALLLLSSSKSQTKGTPNVVPITKFSATRQAAIRAIVTNLQNRNLTVIGSAAKYTGPGADMPPGAVAGAKHVRSAHHNAAGWLPATPVPNALPALAGIHAAWAAPAGLAAGHTPQSIEADYVSLPSPTVNAYLNGVIVPAIPAGVAPAAAAKALAQYGWMRYAENSDSPNTTYIEFDAVDLEGISRVIWDYAADRFYATYHYLSLSGYSPFFYIDATPALTAY